MKNILGSCTYYEIDLLKLPRSKYAELAKDFSLDADTSILMLSEEDIEHYFITSEAINYDSQEFDEDELECNLYDLLGKHPYYLVLGQGMRWNGVSGYKICDKVIDTCIRNYDVTILLQEQTKNAILCRESSHDRPTGHPIIITGLSNEEYEKLIDADFNEIEKFALSKV